MISYDVDLCVSWCLSRLSAGCNNLQDMADWSYGFV